MMRLSSCSLWKCNSTCKSSRTRTNPVASSLARNAGPSGRNYYNHLYYVPSHAKRQFSALLLHQQQRRCEDGNESVNRDILSAHVALETHDRVRLSSHRQRAFSFSTKAKAPDTESPNPLLKNVNTSNDEMEENDRLAKDRHRDDSSVVVQLKSNMDKELHSFFSEYKNKTNQKNQKNQKNQTNQTVSSSRSGTNSIRNRINRGKRNDDNSSNSNSLYSKRKTHRTKSTFKPLFQEIDEIMGKVKRGNPENFKLSDERRRKNRNRRSMLYQTNDDIDESNESNESDGSDGSDGSTQMHQTKSKRNIDFTSFFDINTTSSKQKEKRNAKNGHTMERNLFDTTPTTESTSSTNTSFSEPKKSIFDAFPIPKKNNPNAFDNYAFEQYNEIMTELTQTAQYRRKSTKRQYDEEFINPVIDWLLKDEPLLQYEYTILNDALEYGINAISTSKSDVMIKTEGDDSTSNTSSDDQIMTFPTAKMFKDDVYTKGSQSHLFLQSIQSQKEKFMKESGLSEKQYKLAVRALNILATKCAKTGSSSSLTVAWEKIKEAGIVPSFDAMNTYLYITGTMGVSTFGLSSTLSSKQIPQIGQNTSLSAVINILGSQKAQSKSSVKNNNNYLQQNDSEQKNQTDFPTELALFHDLLFEPTEKSISLRVRKLVSQGNAEEAEALLDSFPSTDDAKLRTYLPVLKLYCEQGSLGLALKLFKRMRNEPTVRLEPENYILLLSSFAENGCFRKDAQDVDGICDLGYIHASGPELFDELLNEMAEDVLEITSASARRLYNAIATGFEGVEGVELKPIDSLGGLVTNNVKAEKNELIASRVTIGETTGICPRSGAKLQLIKLQRDERQQLHQSLLQLATSRFEEFSGDDRDGDSMDYAERSLNSFADWLNTRKGNPFTAIIDGANIAYYMQNFEGGTFNFYQIKFMVEALEKMNENPLVIIPYKYMCDKFFVNMGARPRYHVVDAEEKKILKELTKKGQLYRVPARCLDDYYWMLASVSNQTTSRNGDNMDVMVDNEEGRWPGARPMLISNDQMRDHKLGLLEPKLFRRWFGCYIVNYNFTAFVGNESVDREIGFSPADIFSREIQANDTNSGKIWHIPVNDWNLDDRFCIRIPINK